jgi:molybdenum ABC transporter molybdate-binding protein
MIGLRRFIICILLASICAFSVLAPGTAASRDLVVLGEPSLMNALRSVAALWQARSGQRVNVFVAPTDLSYAQIERGARCDVIFALAGVETNEAAQRKIIHADTVSRIFRNGLALIGGERAAPIAAPLDIARLIDGKRVAIGNPDRDISGARALEFLGKVGFAAQASANNLMVAESSAGVADLIATGKVPFGIVYSSDAIPRFKPIAALPLDQGPIEFIVATARDPQVDTREFLLFLRSAPVKNAFTSAGLDPIGQ